MSEQYRISVIFEGRDQLTGIAKNVSEGMSEVAKTSSKFASALSDVGKVAAGVISGLVGFNVLGEVRRFAEEATRAFVEFEAASVKLAALSREAGQSTMFLAQVFRTVASAAAREYAVSGQQAVQALESLVKAGLSGRDAIAALGDVIKLARIEGADFATASNAVVQVMAQFGLKGHEAARAVDVLVNASRLGIGAATDFANGLANVGATAKAMGLGIEDATTWLVVLERRFGNAQEAGTHLNRFLLELGEIARKLGVSITDAEGRMRDMNEVILDVIAVVRDGGLSFAELQDRLKGVDMRALKALFTFAQMTENVEELREAVGRAGMATEAFGDVMETTAGKFQRMQAQVDLMQRRIGEGFAMIATTLGSVFLPSVDYAVGAFTYMLSRATGNVVGELQGQIQIWLALGRATEETAADYIANMVEMGRISVVEGLKIAESLGVSSEKLVELALQAENVGQEVPESFRKAAEGASTLKKEIETSGDVLVNIAKKFGVTAEKALELAKTVLGLNLEFDENADLVSKLASTYGITESQAREFINTLKQEGEALKKAAEEEKKAKEEKEKHMRVVEQMRTTLQNSVQALLEFGMGFGPMRDNIAKAREALQGLIGEGERIPSALSGFLNFMEDLNNKFASLERQSKALSGVQSVAATGMSYFNTVVSVQKGLVADQVHALKAQIEGLKRQEEELRRAMETNQSYADVYRRQIEAIRTQRTELEQQLQQIQQSIELTAQQAASQEKLAAIQQALGFVSQVTSLQQTALQLAMLGADEAANMYLNTSILLADAMSDGVVTNEEYKNILQALGITFDETGKPVINLKGIMEDFKNKILETKGKVEEFRSILQSLHGMTIHTYHYHHQITIQETRTAGGGGQAQIVHETGGRFFEEYQRGTWFVPYTGPAILHRGEMVIPADIAEEIRRGRAAAGRGNIVVNISVNGAGMDADQLAEVISRRMVARLRAL